ncbi:hypothetical protein [Thioclava indica]|uniref:NnrT protein n=1 Tax=Thioclava indica TaxID=1353528 RepID=A0A074KF09_9RHOB|nr:hypothetical protein [Thioclava indica]KEO60102.1 hypothetical protein DT23_14520 [Thioclava indica]
MKLRKPLPSWKLLLGLYPFAAAAVAINLFMLFLMLQAVGVAALTPLNAVLAAIPLGLPATWAAARWVQHLIAEAERTPQ